MLMLAEPSNDAEPDMSPVRVKFLALASLVAVAALPIKEAVMAPASKLPSASLFTRVLAMLESASSRLCEKGMPHYGSPDKDPAVRLETIELAGKANVPFTSGIFL